MEMRISVKKRFAQSFDKLFVRPETLKNCIGETS